MQQDFLAIYMQEYDKLTRSLRCRLLERGYRGSLKDAIKQIMQRIGEQAYRNSKKEYLTRSYAIKKLIWLKSNNELYNFLHPPKKDAACEEINDDLAPTDPEPNAHQRLEIQEQLDIVKPWLSRLSPQALDIFTRLAENASYEELAAEFNSTSDALKQQVYRWRKKIRKQLNGKS